MSVSCPRGLLVEVSADAAGAADRRRRIQPETILRVDTGLSVAI